MRPFLTLTAVLALSALLAGCVTTPKSTDEIPLLPAQAVLAAAEKPEGVSGVFKLEVRGGGRESGLLYLNSEADYRDQRCLTLTIVPAAARALELKFAGDPITMLNGKTLLATGTAKRVTVWFYSNGRRTDKYYYQTQVLISDPSQIRVQP